MNPTIVQIVSNLQHFLDFTFLSKRAVIADFHCFRFLDFNDLLLKVFPKKILMIMISMKTIILMKIMVAMKIVMIAITLTMNYDCPNCDFDYQSL